MQKSSAGSRGESGRQHADTRNRHLAFEEEKRTEIKEERRQTDRQRGSLLAAISVMQVTYTALVLPQATATRTEEHQQHLLNVGVSH